MRVIAYKNLCAQKKKSKIKIFCTPKLFKPLMIAMSIAFVLLATNLFVNNFFVNIKASIENFVNSFVKMFL